MKRNTLTDGAGRPKSYEWVRPEAPEVNGLLQGAKASGIYENDLAPGGAFSKAVKEAKGVRLLANQDPEEEPLKELSETVKISARIPRELTDYEKYGYSSFTEMVVEGLKAVTGLTGCTSPGERPLAIRSAKSVKELIDAKKCILCGEGVERAGSYVCVDCEKS
jgi:hypothetical protein